MAVASRLCSARLSVSSRLRVGLSRCSVIRSVHAVTELPISPQLSEIDWGFPISVRGLVMQGRDVHLGWFGRRTAVDNAAVDDALERTGMSGLADRPAESLSGGQRQRALLGRALAQNAELLLLDEPLTALDQENRNAITSVIDDLLARGGAVLMSTHHIDDARAAGYDIVTMNAGRVEHAAAAQT